jgi:hypothetical protein
MHVRVRRSIGVIVFVMLSGRPPFCEDNLEDAVLDQAWSLSGPEWNVVSEQGKDFVKQLMQQQPEDRLSAERALAHPWITGALPEPSQLPAAGAVGGAAAGRSDTLDLLGEAVDASPTRHNSAPSTLDLLPDMLGDENDGDGDDAAAAALPSRAVDGPATGGAGDPPRHHSDPVHGSSSSSMSSVGEKRDRDESASAERQNKRPATATNTEEAAAAAAAPSAAAGSGGGAAGGFSWTDPSQDSLSLDSQSDSQTMSLSQALIDDDVGWIWVWRAGSSWKRYESHVNRSIEQAYQDFVRCALLASMHCASPSVPLCCTAFGSDPIAGSVLGCCLSLCDCALNDFVTQIEEPGDATKAYALPGGEHLVHFEPYLTSAQQLPAGCTGAETGIFGEFSLCLSRACLGKIIVFIYKWLKNAVLHRDASEQETR